MGFKLQTSPTFWWPVTLDATAEDGKHIQGEVRVRFKRKPLDDARKYAEAIFGKPMLAETAAPLIEEWEGYEDDSGPVPFSVDALTRLCQYTATAPKAFVDAFFKGNSGAREGN